MRVLAVLAVLLMMGEAGAFSLELVDSFSLPFNGQDIEVSGDYAYIASGRMGLFVLDLNTHRVVGSFSKGRGVFGVAIQGDTAYVGAGDGGVYKLDISHLRAVRRYTVPGDAFDVDIHKGHLYIASGPFGLQVFNLTSSRFVTSGSIPGRSGRGALGVTIAGDLAYVAADGDGVYLMNITRPSFTTKTYRYSFPLPVYPAQNLAVSDGYLYLAKRRHELGVFDIHNPASPREIAAYNFPTRVMGVTVSGDRVYAVGEGRIYILEIKEETPPARVETPLQETTVGT